MSFGTQTLNRPSKRGKSILQHGYRVVSQLPVLLRTLSAIGSLPKLDSIGVQRTI